jgi:hypothetical protein
VRSFAASRLRSSNNQKSSTPRPERPTLSGEPGELHFNKEIGRRTDVVGIFPDDRSLIRLAGMLCIEQNDEWLVGRGYLSAESVSQVLTGPSPDIHTEIKEETAELQAA